MIQFLHSDFTIFELFEDVKEKVTKELENHHAFRKSFPIILVVSGSTGSIAFKLEQSYNTIHFKTSSALYLETPNLLHIIIK